MGGDRSWARGRARPLFAGLCAAMLGGCGGSHAGSPVKQVAPNGPALPVAPIGHHGRWLTDADGRVILFHGVNVVNKNPPYVPAAEGFSDADAAWLAANGLRVVRVGVLATGLMPTPGVVDTSYITQVAATVSDLAKHDVYSLIDFHQDGWGPSVGSDGFPAWMTLTGSAMNDTSATFPTYYEKNPALQQAFQSFWDDAQGPDGKSLQDDYAAMFGALAKQFAAEPHVLGYDLFNEPWPGTTWTDCLNQAGGCPSLDKGELGPAYAKALAAIRAAGDQHLVFGEPFNVFNFGNSATSIPVPGGDANAGMSFHVYPLLQSQIPAVVANAVSWSEATGGALLNTEWGATTDPTFLTNNVVALDGAFVPWMFWSFCCELIPSLQSAAGGTNLVASTASVVLEAHPLAVAGTPKALTTDPSARTLSFTWATSPPEGSALSSEAVTSLEVPAPTYPDGYTATVTNGWVTSAPCAPLLTVAPASGAETVTVDLRPGGKCP